jgi:hypothetical protein
MVTCNIFIELFHEIIVIITGHSPTLAKYLAVIKERFGLQSDTIGEPCTLDKRLSAPRTDLGILTSSQFNVSSAPATPGLRSEPCTELSAYFLGCEAASRANWLWIV